jgi:TolA-binding protein
LGSRAASLLALLALLAPLTACGDDNNAFKQDYNQAVQPLTSLGDDVGQSLTRAAGESNKELAARYERLAGRLDEVRENLEGLESPEGAQQQLDELLAALEEGSRRLRKLADAAKEGRPSEANAAAGALVATGERLRKAETELREAVDG